MSKRVAVITGSSSGIGAATARLFARNGFNIVINYSRDAAPAQVVADECRALGAEVLVIKANVADDNDCRALAQAVGDKWGRADALVNNAGTTRFVDSRDLEGLCADDFHDIYAVNVIGAFQMVRAVAPLLRANSGAAIVNVSSTASVAGIGSSIAYMASKGALNAMTFGLARSLGPAIRVNAVGPGIVETNWLEKGIGPERYDAARKAFVADSTLAATVVPEDVADACYWLCTGAAKTTGEFILVDSGYAKFPVLGAR
jgi:3-oxoacyl-[acyl-carrier protein] reductase